VPKGVVTGLLTGHNAIRKHLYIMGLIDCPICRKCGGDEKTSPHFMCDCKAFASIRHTRLGSFFLDPEDVRSPNGMEIY
jgi:hypothetical protein